MKMQRYPKDIITKIKLKNFIGSEKLRYSYKIIYKWTSMQLNSKLSLVQRLNNNGINNLLILRYSLFPNKYTEKWGSNSKLRKKCVKK
jgi:hypothetical protein